MMILKLCVLSALATRVSAHLGHSHHGHDHGASHRRELGEVDPCGTLEESEEEKEKAYQKMKLWKEMNGPIPEQTITIPTYWHIIRASDGSGGVTTTQISNSMAVLNDLYAPHGFAFTWEGYTQTNSDSYNLHTSGTDAEYNMKLATRQGDEGTLNIWSCEAPKSGSSGNTVAGYAYFPTIIASSPTKDGVVLSDFTLDWTDGTYDGDTLVHEVGHWLYLYHVFSDDCDDPNGDYVDDTPTQLASSFDCVTGQDTCPGVSGVDSINNYMDYSSKPCRIEFTSGQEERMKSAYYIYRDTNGTPEPTPAPTPSPLFIPTDDDCVDDTVDDDGCDDDAAFSPKSYFARAYCSVLGC